jgi:KaiC/GvpD/RAD55 family RecA-like ATPase
MLFKATDVIERLKKGLYTFILVTGLPGTGKSSVCIRLAELINLEIKKEFDKQYDLGDIKVQNIMDDLLEFIRFTKSANKKGKIGIIEEVSVLFGSRRAMAQENVAVGRILDTCRKLETIVIANAPIFTSIDSHMRAMAHVLIETDHINKTQGVVVSRAWRLQTNPHTGKTYRHRFTRASRDVTHFFTKKSNSGVWDEYELKKDKFLDNLYTKLERAQEKKDGKIAKELGMEKRKIVKKLTETEIRRWTLRQSGLSHEKIAIKEGVSRVAITQCLDNITKKTNLLGGKPLCNPTTTQ